MLQWINVCGNVLHNFAGMSKVMRNTHSPVPKFRPCSPYLLSSTSMLVWSGFFTVWLWITCFHHPLRTGMLYFESDPEKLLKHEIKNKSISSTFHHFLFRILKGFKIFSNREMHLPKKMWHIKLMGMQMRLGTTGRFKLSSNFHYPVFFLFPMFCQLKNMKKEKKNDVE